jgi:CRP-like cAMP-binding protein
MEIEFLLRQTHLFESLSGESLKALAGICLNKKAEKNELLFQEGQAGFSVYILIHGAVQLYKTRSDGRRVVIKTLQKGDLFGEVILFETNRYPVTAQALKPSRLFLLPKHQLLCLLENRSFRDEFIGNLMGKLRYLADRIQVLTHLDVRERFVLFLREQYGEKDTIRPQISKKSLAEAIGTTPETLSRLLQSLQEEGLLKWEGAVMEVEPKFWKKYN